MKNLIYLLIIVLAGVIGYMYFFGKGEDRKKAADIVNETEELGKSIGDFIKRQKEKYDEGEFDQLLDKVSKTINKVRKKESPATPEENERLKKLEEDLRQIEPEKLNEDDRERLKKLLDDLEHEIAETG